MTADKNHPKDLDGDPYELTDDGHGPFDGFDADGFVSWLKSGLKNYLIYDKGAWAFPEVAGTIARQDLVDGLCEVYQGLSPNQQEDFRKAVGYIIATLPNLDENIPVMEHLLSLAAVLPAPEILPALPTKIGQGFFGRTANQDENNLFALALLAAARLTGPHEEAVDCLYALIGAKNYFDEAYAGIALTALCQADSKGLAKHMEKLRDSLAAQFISYGANEKAKRDLALSVLDHTNFHHFVQALPELRYFDAKNQQSISDTWIIHALFQGNTPVIKCKAIEKEIEFFRAGSKVPEFLPWKDTTSFRDLIEVLRTYGYIEEEGVDEPLKMELPSQRPDYEAKLLESFGITPVEDAT